MQTIKENWFNSLLLTIIIGLLSFIGYTNYEAFKKAESDRDVSRIERLELLKMMYDNINIDNQQTISIGRNREDIEISKQDISVIKQKVNIN